MENAFQEAFEELKRLWAQGGQHYFEEARAHYGWRDGRIHYDQPHRKNTPSTGKYLCSDAKRSKEEEPMGKSSVTLGTRKGMLRVLRASGSFQGSKQKGERKNKWTKNPLYLTGRLCEVRKFQKYMEGGQIRCAGEQRFFNRQHYDGGG